MKSRKELLDKLLCPPIWLVVILIIFCTAALTMVFVKGRDTSPVAYVVYVLSFYTLTVSCIGCVKVFPAWYRGVRQRIYANKFGNRYMTDAAFKTHVSLYVSLTINLLYVVMNLVSGYLYRSAWFIILAVYYSILAIMRFLLLRYVNHNAIGQKLVAELRRSRLCAIILMTVNIVLSGAVLMIIYQNRGYEYQGFLIYVVAMYTFYATMRAVINIVKYRKYNSPVMSTAKVISLTAALVTMLNLETAMLSQFGTESTSPYFERIMISATGGGVAVIVVGLSIYMIVRATKEIRRLKIKGDRYNGESE